MNLTAQQIMDAITEFTRMTEAALASYQHHTAAATDARDQKRWQRERDRCEISLGTLQCLIAVIERIDALAAMPKEGEVMH